jgi:hypothetical protein
MQPNLRVCRCSSRCTAVIFSIAAEAVLQPCLSLRTDCPVPYVSLCCMFVSMRPPPPLLPICRCVLQIFRFYYRCTNCAAEFCMRTDPKTADYVMEQGASRNYEPWREVSSTAQHSTLWGTAWQCTTVA